MRIVSKIIINIGDKVRDKNTGKVETVVDKTSNSYEVTRAKIKDAGINSTNWFTEEEFFKQFNLITPPPTRQA